MRYTYTWDFLPEDKYKDHWLGKYEVGNEIPPPDPDVDVERTVKMIKDCMRDYICKCNAGEEW